MEGGEGEGGYFNYICTALPLLVRWLLPRICLGILRISVDNKEDEENDEKQICHVVMPQKSVVGPAGSLRGMTFLSWCAGMYIKLLPLQLEPF